MANKSIYLIASYISRPKDPSQTRVAGYTSNPDNMVLDEQVYVTRGLRNKDLKNTVILNLTEEKIVKNGWRSGVKFEELFQHYYDGYAEYIDNAVNTLNAE